MHTQTSLTGEASGTHLTAPAASEAGSGHTSGWRTFLKKKQKLAFSLATAALLTIGFTSQVAASHFRSGNLSWRATSGNTVEFRITQGWRGVPALGATMYSDRLYFGDGTSQQFSVVATAVDTVENWYYGEVLVTKTYATAGNFSAYFGSCCRISTLKNNADGSWRLQTLVNVGSGNNAPITSVPPIIKLASGKANATFTIPAVDPDGNQLKYRMAIPTRMGGGTNPAGMTVDSLTGKVYWSTLGLVNGHLYNAAVTIFDGQTEITVDFIIEITGNSNAPYFDYAITPANGQTISVNPGQPLNFTVRALDADSGDVVRLQGISLPLSAQVNPLLPAKGNPVSAVFTWTPATSDIGTKVITFTAQDLVGVQATTTIIVKVGYGPRFDVPPTPAHLSTIGVKPGMAVTIPVQASDVDALDVVQILSATGLPASASFGNLPTAAANPTSASLSWTPQTSDWGPRQLTIKAQDSQQNQATHQLSFIVNTLPVFTSAPVTTAQAGQLYTYHIQVNEPDLPYGDVLEIVGNGLPTWLTLTDNGNGTATLSGTPQAADAGANQVVVMAEDIYHHVFGTHISQSFTINVAGCNLSLAIATTNVSCPGMSNGSLNLTVSNGTAPFTYTWQNGQLIESLTGLAAGTYIVAVTDANGCSTSASATVGTNPAPVVTLPAFSNVCSNGVITLSGGLPAGGTYAGKGVSGTTFRAETAGQGTHLITYTYTNAAGCSASATSSITVSGRLVVNAGPDQSFTAPMQTCATLNGSVSGGTAPYTYTWSNNAQGATATVCPTATATYTLKVTDALGCSSSDEVIVYVKNGSCGHNGNKVLVCHNGHTICIAAEAVPAHLAHGCSVGQCEGVRAMGTDNSGPSDLPTLTAAPNPANGYARIEYSQPVDGQVTLELYDARGALVKALCTTAVQAQETYAYQLETSQLPQGVYVARLSSADHVQHLRLIIQH